MAHNPATRIFTGDYETGDFSQWSVVQIVGYNSTASGYDGSSYSMLETVDVGLAYFDGDTSGASWDGTTGLSTSTLLSTLPPAVIDTDPVDVAIETGAAQFLHPPPVDLTADTLGVTAAHAGEAEPVDVAVEVAAATAGGTSPDPVTVTVDTLPVTVGSGGVDTSASQRGLPPVVYVPTARFLAQSILTGQWLHWDLPIVEPEITWALSGPTVISGRFEPEIRDLADLGLEPWGVWIHMEDAGLIRASGILQPTSLDGEKLAIEAIGPSGYAARIPYRGTYAGIQVDPADVVRHLWAHIQSHPRGDLGVIVNGSTPVRIGTAEQDVSFETGTGEQIDFTAGPYKLSWWENTLCGTEIDELARETPFDYLEQCAWNADKTDVVHWIDLQHPRIGRRLFTLRFADGGENVLESAPIEEPDKAYASQVYVQGKGEGDSAVTGYAGRDIGGRLRLPVVVEDKTIATTDRAKAVAAEQLAARQAALVECPQIAVNVRHPNAKLGTFGPGDEIPLQLSELPYVGEFAAWHRVLSVRYLPDAEVAVLDLTRRDEFNDRGWV